MRSLLVSLLPLAVSSAVLNSRQAPTSSPPNPLAGLLGPLAGILSGGGNVGDNLSKALPKAKLANVKTVAPQLRPTAKRVIASYGPYVLSGKGQPKEKTMGMSLDPNGHAFIDLISDGLCRNCTVLTGKTSLTFADGSEAGPAQGVYIHHVISRDITKPANLPITKCGKGQTRNALSANNLGAEFLAQGDDTTSPIIFTSQDGSYQSGFMIGAEDKILNQVDLVNYNAESKSVYVVYEIEFVEGFVGSDAAATLMSVTGCSIPVPKDGKPAVSAINLHNLDKDGVAVTESPEFDILRDSKIIDAWGHMHDGGAAMILKINGKEICHSKAHYGKGGDNNQETILEMSQCDKNIPIKKGDTLQLKSVYDLKTHPLRVGGEKNALGTADVMAMFYITFAVDK